MSTTEPQIEWSPKLNYVSDEYEQVYQGRTYRCRKFELFGAVLESCQQIDPPKNGFTPLIPEPFVEPGSELSKELTAYMDQFLIPREESTAE